VANETEGGAGATSEASGNGDESLRLAGNDTPKALADALAAHWVDAVAALSRGEVEEHARATLHDEALAGDIAEIAGDKSVAEDTRLFRVILRLDPRQNAEFMGYEISEQGLGELGAEVDGPFPTWSANAALRIMDTDRVLTLYAEATKTPRFRELDDRWHSEFGDWTKLVNRSRKEGGPDIYSQAAWRTRAKIFRGLLDTKDDDALRARAREAMKKPTVAEWASDAGSLEGAGVGTLMGVADLGDAADVYDDARKVERKQANSKRRRGIVSGVVSVALIALVVFGVAAFTKGTNEFDFTTTEPSKTATVEQSIDPATADVIGTATITKDTPLLTDPDASSEVVQELKKDDRVFQIGHDKNGFYFVKLATDDKVFGWVDKSNAAIICPVQCG
jgi:hypothetical protein